MVRECARGDDPGMEQSELPAILAHDADHWWFRGRRRIVNGELERLALPPNARLLDAGCGSGRTLDDLARFGLVTGLDISPIAVGVARRRGHDVRLADIADIPLPDERFDVVTCLDVLEHVRDDRRALGELVRVTRPGGTILVTAPAYPALWSAHDVANEHFRRYRRSALRALAAQAGCECVRDTHFNAVLLPPIAIVRWAMRFAGRPRGAPSDLDLTPARLDPVLELPLRAEARFLAVGGRLPLGLSLLMVLRPGVRGANAPPPHEARPPQTARQPKPKGRVSAVSATRESVHAATPAGQRRANMVKPSKVAAVAAVLAMTPTAALAKTHPSSAARTCAP
jgi:SAM-dependent methyltransferase